MTDQTDWIERELESGRVIRVPDYEHSARPRLRVDTGMAASGAILPIRRALESPGFALEATFTGA